MRTLLIATAAAVLLGAAGFVAVSPASAQDTMGASKSHMTNPQTVPEKKRTNKNVPAQSKRDNPNPPGPVQQNGNGGSGTSVDTGNQNPRTKVK